MHFDVSDANECCGMLGVHLCAGKRQRVLHHADLRRHQRVAEAIQRRRQPLHGVVGGPRRQEVRPVARQGPLVLLACVEFADAIGRLRRSLGSAMCEQVHRAAQVKLQ